VLRVLKLKLSDRFGERLAGVHLAVPGPARHIGQKALHAYFVVWE